MIHPISNFHFFNFHFPNLVSIIQSLCTTYVLAHETQCSSLIINKLVFFIIKSLSELPQGHPFFWILFLSMLLLVLFFVVNVFVVALIVVAYHFVLGCGQYQFISSTCVVWWVCGVVWKLIFMSHPPTVKVEVALWLS